MYDHKCDKCSNDLPFETNKPECKCLFCGAINKVSLYKVKKKKSLFSKYSDDDEDSVTEYLINSDSSHSDSGGYSGE
jgi:uncharacterized Zn finger protein